MKLKFAEAISVPESQRRPVAESINYRSIGTIVLLLSFISCYIPMSVSTLSAYDM